MLMNDFDNIPAESDLRDFARIEPQEQNVDRHTVRMDEEQQEKFLAEAREIREGEIARDPAFADIDTPLGEYYGDGSGTDDLADYNQNEAADYSNE